MEVVWWGTTRDRLLWSRWVKRHPTVFQEVVVGSAHPTSLLEVTVDQEAPYGVCRAGARPAPTEVTYSP
jgi:hypothetical protein